MDETNAEQNVKERTEKKQAEPTSEVSRRNAIKKLGKYGGLSAVVTAVVYSGVGSRTAMAFSPPPPPVG